LKTLTLIVPPLMPPTRDSADEARWPGLARLAGRGSLTPRILDARLGSLPRAVLDALGLSNVAAGYPSAAVIRTGASGERAGGFWLRAQPIHFAAGLDRLTTVVLQGDARMSEAERAQLVPVLGEHVQSSGFELHDASNDEWLLRSEHPLQVQTVSPEFAAANPRAEILPQGRDAGGLRRLMTEMQMLLHEHPVNAQRQARGVPAINAVWFHGEGMLTGVTPVQLPKAYGEDLFLRGIYRLHDQVVAAPPADAAALLSAVLGPTVAVIDVADLDALETRWLAPLQRALLAGSIAKVDLLLDQWRVTADRFALFKLWRRERPPGEWAAC
jgi:hypothetical protein